jgi:hypothetical protein
MEVINYSILRNNLKEVLDRVSEDQSDNDEIIYLNL